MVDGVSLAKTLIPNSNHRKIVVETAVGGSSCYISSTEYIQISIYCRASASISSSVSR